MLLVAALTLAGGLPAWAANKDGNVQVTHDSKHDVSPPLRQMALTAALKGGEGLEKFEKEELRPPKGYLTAVPGNDPVVQEAVPATGCDQTRIELRRNQPPGSPGFPPDTNGTVGATQFVEQAGAALQVYDKATGKALLPKPVAIDTLFQGFGGLCETTNGGDLGCPVGQAGATMVCVATRRHAKQPAVFSLHRDIHDRRCDRKLLSLQLCGRAESSRLSEVWGVARCLLRKQQRL